MLKLDGYDFTPRSREGWAIGIGLFLSRLAEIERLTHYIRLLMISAPEKSEITTTSLGQLSKSWVNLSFEERLDKLIADISRKESFKDVEACLNDTKRLLDVRNIIMHGTFAIKVGSTPDRPNYCIWSLPKKPNPGSKSDRTLREDVVHVENFDQATSDGLHLIFKMEHFIDAYSKENGFEVNELKERRLPFELFYTQTILQSNIGWFVVAMGEIEIMIVTIYQKVLNPKYEDGALEPTRRLSGHWLDLTLKARLDDLLEKLPGTGEHIFMRAVLQAVNELIVFRNTLAHAILRYETSDSGALQLMAVRHVRSGLEKITKSEVVANIKKAMRLSDDLSEAIARVGFELNYDRRVRLGWVAKVN
ncbi:hypothetical protein OC926_02635 [Pseudomonas peradeniyensis]|uniref:hypothetical protein n=1 Tax=Pseudomonas peradeniyensis TaxID=2745488 RepID=UPI0021D4985C|nr:hypothetical protein [Pseudomonas peradeniyensis]MCU7278729.1 hypothetical protein [Pseudomonas peradeniyensis]